VSAEKSVDASMDDLNAFISDSHEKVTASQMRLKQKKIELVRNTTSASRSFIRESCSFADMTSVDQGVEALDYVNAVITRDMRLILVDIAIRLCPCIPRLLILTNKLEDRILQTSAQNRLFAVSRFQFQTQTRSSMYIPVYRWLCGDSVMTRDFLESAWNCVRSSGALGTARAKTMHRGWQAFLDVWVNVTRSVVQCNQVSLPNAVGMSAAVQNCRSKAESEALDAFEADLRKDYVAYARELDRLAVFEDDHTTSAISKDPAHSIGTKESAAYELLRLRDSYFYMSADALVYDDEEYEDVHYDVSSKKRKMSE
jgi:hypothetical protein